MVSDQRHAPAALLPGKSPGTHLTRSCLDPKDGLDYIHNGKISCPCRDTNLVAILTTLFGLPLN
jgi:hypothetical protein